MSSLKGTQTEQNLLKAFAGESQARNRYTYFAKAAKKEGFEQISAIFTETAENELQHAKVFFKHLEGGPVEITATYPAGVIGTTAEKEGFKEVANSFRQIAKVEAWHEKRYRRLIANLEKDEVFAKPETVKWVCRKCGFVHEGPKALKICPACQHPQAYQELYAENF